MLLAQNEVCMNSRLVGARMVGGLTDTARAFAACVYPFQCIVVCNIYLKMIICLVCNPDPYKNVN
jgi:hypothetical protein